jgi:hypothetical protein
LLRHFGPATKTSGDRSCERWGSRPNTLIGQPTHRLAVQASLTTGVASYHSSVVKVRRAAVLPAPERTDSTTAACPSSRETKNRCKAPAFASAQRGPALFAYMFGLAHACWAKRRTSNIIDT